MTSQGRHLPVAPRPYRPFRIGSLPLTAERAVPDGQRTYAAPRCRVRPQDARRSPERRFPACWGTECARSTAIHTAGEPTCRSRNHEQHLWLECAARHQRSSGGRGCKVAWRHVSRQLAPAMHDVGVDAVGQSDLGYRRARRLALGNDLVFQFAGVAPALATLLCFHAVQLFA